MEIPYTITARPDTGLSNGKLGIWLFLASEVMLFGALFTAYLFVRLGAEDGTWPSHVQSIPLGLTNTVLLIISSITMVWAWVALKERKFNTYRLALALTMLCGVLFLCIKGREYYDKYLHWGFLIKEDSFAKYEPTLKKMDVFYSPIPSQHAFEVRGHLHSSNDTSFTFLPDKNFHPWGETPTPGGTDSTENTVNAPKSGKDAEEETLTLPKSDLERWGNFLPAYGTYYAMYFTVTGLHAMHIIGGLVVMAYFIGPGAKMYRRNPEQLSNRIEVTGIFWHFVDLVWITVFPILYLT
jgi:cytochrome c oxidase subunit 3